MPHTDTGLPFNGNTSIARHTSHQGAVDAAPRALPQALRSRRQHRMRAAVCKECGAAFQARVSQPGHYCSRRCALRQALRVKSGYDPFTDRLTQFEAHLEKDRTPDACWKWTGAKYRNGYSRFKDGEYAHRASYELYRGAIPEGLTIDHLCGNKGCVNPAHFEAVTQEENTRRGWSRRRPNPPSKLSSADVETVKARYARGETQTRIGADYGVSQTYIGMIVRGVLRGTNR